MRILSALALAAAPLAVHAQTAPAPARDPGLEDLAPDIIVTAPFRLTRADLLSSIDVVSGLELTRDVRSTIGDTLTRQPGVSATSFGPNASRPVLRGLQGERVRVLRDGIGALDVSNTSVDHAVTINPLTAQRVEILRGPATLLYGSSAIGGVVNVIDRRIPRAVPTERFHVDLLGGYGSAADEAFGGGHVDLNLGGGLVAHVDGSYRRNDDLRVGGFVVARALREELAEDGDPAATLRGRLPNTDNEFFDVAGSLAWVGDTGSIGVSVSRLENRYGVPIRFGGAGHAHEEGEEHGGGEEADEEGGGEAVALDLRQTRIDFRGEKQLGGFFSNISARLGYNDYTHDEIELAENEVGTTFSSKGIEGRVELEQAKRGVWRAVHGVQFLSREFDAVGAEAYIPRNDTFQIGLFTLHEFDLGNVRAEVGGRYERTAVDSEAVGFDREFDAFSVSAGASAKLTDMFRVGVNLSRNERAPAAEELLADGPHIATQAFEIGLPNARTEKSYGAELFLRGGTGRFTLNASVYYNHFEDFLELFPTGDEEDGLPVFQVTQNNADFWGFEVEGSAVLGRVGRFDLAADVVVDATWADIDRVGPAPRIPPLRVLGGLEARSPAIIARVEAETVSSQRRLAEFETPTDAFTLVNASVAIRPFGANNGTTLVLAANNLGDVSARRHASFVKDVAPLAGRDIRLTLRVAY